MQFSVVIPAWKEEARIAAAVAQAWQLGPHEVIVSDGFSPDATADLAKSAGAHVVQAGPGRGTQLNAGWRAAAADLLLFLHADCRLLPQAAEQMTQALADTAIIGGAFRQQIDGRGWRYRLLEHGNAARVRWRQLPYGDQGIFLRRHVLESLGGFPEEPFLEDLLLMRQARKLGRICLLPGPLVTSARRWQAHGVIRQTLRNWAITAAACCGVSPKTLARYYARHA